MRANEVIITLLGGAAATWPIAASAQQQAKLARVGIIDDAPIWNHFRQGLHDLGYVEGQTIAFEYRTAEGEPERLAAVATELARVPVDVIAAYGTAPANAAKSATTSFPIVAISEPRAPRRQCHRQYRPGSRHWRQTDTAHQRGHPNRLAGGFSLESR